MLLGIVNFIVDDQQAHAIVERLVGALPAGSYLAMTHPTTEVHSEKAAEVTRRWNESGAAPICTRSRQELARFFDGLELLEPGVVSSSQCRGGRVLRRRTQTLPNCYPRRMPKGRGTGLAVAGAVSASGTLAAGREVVEGSLR